MSTAVLEREETNTITIDLNSIIQVDPVLRMQAEAVLAQSGMSVSKAVELLMYYTVKLKKIPDTLIMPPIPCLDDMTDEEFDDMLQEAFDDIDKGRTYTIEEARSMMEAKYGNL